MYPNIIDGDIGFYGCIFFVFFFVLIVWFGTNIMTALIIDAYVQAKQGTEDKGMQRTRSFVGGKPPEPGAEDLEMYRRNADNNPVTPFLQARLPAGGAQKSACNRCGDCAVFLAKIESKQICHCGHGKMYHLGMSENQGHAPNTGTGDTAPLAISSRLRPIPESVLQSIPPFKMFANMTCFQVSLRNSPETRSEPRPYVNAYVSMCPRV